MKKAILFDFDGVIVDSFDFVYVLHKLNHPGASADEYRRYFEGNIFDSLKEKPGSKNVIKSNDHYSQLYGPELMKLGVIDDMADVINNLAADHELFIVSSSDSRLIRDFLAREKLLGRFKEILGSDVHYNKFEKINMILDKYKLAASDCLFLTDTLGDIREAEKCQVKSIAVDWGFHPAETLAKGNPLAIVHTPIELVKAIRSA